MKPWNMVIIVAMLCVISAALGCSDDDPMHDPIPILIPYIDSDPAWSPDGQEIAFFHQGITHIDYDTGVVDANPDSQGVWIVNPDGNDKRMLMRLADLPEWAPDSKWLCVINMQSIWKLKADGDSLTQLTFSGSHFYPSWSPSGQLIASSTSICMPSYPCGVWLTQANGKGSFWLLQGGGPDWAPDGTSIIYIGNLEGERGILTYDISKASSQAIYSIAGAYVSSGPEYSPDGLRIAVGLDFHICVMDADGSGRTQITSMESLGSISWSPDSEQIVYGTLKGLWIINADGTNAHQITFPPN